MKKNSFDFSKVGKDPPKVTSVRCYSSVCTEAVEEEEEKAALLLMVRVSFGVPRPSPLEAKMEFFGRLPADIIAESVLICLYRVVLRMGIGLEEEEENLGDIGEMVMEDSEGEAFPEVASVEAFPELVTAGLFSTSLRVFTKRVCPSERELVCWRRRAPKEDSETAALRAK